jgi:hypothetical protein
MLKVLWRVVHPCKNLCQGCCQRGRSSCCRCLLCMLCSYGQATVTNQNQAPGRRRQFSDLGLDLHFHHEMSTRKSQPHSDQSNKVLINVRETLKRVGIKSRLQRNSLGLKDQMTNSKQYLVSMRSQAEVSSYLACLSQTLLSKYINI